MNNIYFDIKNKDAIDNDQSDKIFRFLKIVGDDLNLFIEFQIRKKLNKISVLPNIPYNEYYDDLENI